MSTCRCSIGIIFLHRVQKDNFKLLQRVLFQWNKFNYLPNGTFLSVSVTFLNNIFIVSYRFIAKCFQRSKFHEKVSVRDRIECQSHSEKYN